MNENATKAALLHVTLDQLQPDPAQPRKKFDEDELQALAQSIRQHGVVQPLTVRVGGENGGYIITAGERRYAAAKIAEVDTVPVLVRDEDRPLVTAMIENLVRQDLSPLEEGLAYKEIGGQAEEIAALVQRPVERVLDRLALAELPDNAKQMILDTVFPLAAARVLVTFNEVDRAVAEKIAGLLTVDETDDRGKIDVHEFARNPVWSLKNVLAWALEQPKRAKALGWIGWPTGVALGVDYAAAYFDKKTVAQLRKMQAEPAPFKLPDYAKLPEPEIDDMQKDLARAYGCLVEVEATHFGSGWVTDIDWFRENIVAGFPAQIEAHYDRYKPSSPTKKKPQAT